MVIIKISDRYLLSVHIIMYVSLLFNFRHRHKLKISQMDVQPASTIHFWARVGPPSAAVT